MTIGQRGPDGQKGWCETGKRCFYRESLAIRAVERAGDRGELPPMRHYKCDKCKWWHLTSQAKAA